MTAPGPPDFPASRRAARASREGTLARAETRAPLRDAAALASPSVAPDPAPVAKPRTAALPISVVAASSSLLAPADSPTRARPPGSAPVGAAHDEHEQGSARRVARVFGSPPPLARHVRRRRTTRLGVALGLLIAGVTVLGSTAAVTAAIAGPATAPAAADGDTRAAAPVDAPAPEATAPPEPALPENLCTDPDIATALAAGDDAGAIAASGGGEPFRSKAAQGFAPCIDLGDPNRLWMVVDKVRPFVPLDFVPPGLQVVGGLSGPQGQTLRADAANALSAMAAASVAAGAGEIGLGSGYRSFDTQRGTYDSLVSAMGSGAEAAVARPGFSEHQSGLTGDLVPCDASGCGTLDDFGPSAQGAWVFANAAQFGWIVRYTEQGRPVTGYESEPWHLRYVGVDLATAYVAGGWTSLEEFFGLPAAPDYLE